MEWLVALGFKNKVFFERNGAGVTNGSVSLWSRAFEDLGLQRMKRWVLGEVEAVEVHDLVPCRDEILNEFFLGIGSRVDFGYGAELGI